MKKIILSLAIIGIVVVATGCEEEKVHTRDYYIKNNEAREVKLKECKNMDTASKNQLKECQFAKSAQSHQRFKNGRNVDWGDLEKDKLVEYYKTHDKERKEKLKKCEKSNEQTEKEQDECAKAIIARNEKLMGK